uniref:Uncharacterized protein n=1 Tax=Arundo donax TaxID=35708 RepID=A0A0A9G2B3_ARUDO
MSSLDGQAVSPSKLLYLSSSFSQP